MHDEWVWAQRALCEGQPPPARSAGWGTVPRDGNGGVAIPGRGGGQMPGAVQGPVVPTGAQLRTR